MGGCVDPRQHKTLISSSSSHPPPLFSAKPVGGNARDVSVKRRALLVIARGGAGGRKGECYNPQINPTTPFDAAPGGGDTGAAGVLPPFAGGGGGRALLTSVGASASSLRSRSARAAPSTTPTSSDCICPATPFNPVEGGGVGVGGSRVRGSAITFPFLG